MRISHPMTLSYLAGTKTLLPTRRPFGWSKRRENRRCGLSSVQAAAVDSSIPSAAPAESASEPGSPAHGTVVTARRSLLPAGEEDLAMSEMWEAGTEKSIVAVGTLGVGSRRRYSKGDREMERSALFFRVERWGISVGSAPLSTVKNVKRKEEEQQAFRSIPLADTSDTI